MNIAGEKLLHHVDRLAEWVETGDSIPINVQICPYDSMCNHRCPMCAAGAKGFTGQILSISTYESLVGDLAALGVRSITLTGGSEPLLHPDFDAISLIAPKYALPQALITNGSVIDVARARLLLETMEWIRVSLDAATPALFRKNHGVGAQSFEGVFENLKLLVRIRSELATCEPENRYAKLGIGFLTHPIRLSVAEIVPAAKLARDIGLDYVQYRPMLKPPNLPERRWNDEPLHVEIIEQLQEATKLRTDRFQVLFRFDKYDRIARHVVKPYSKCPFINFAPAVSASGNVSLCCHHMENDQFLIGNLGSAPFSKIWATSRERRLVETRSLEQCPLLCRGTGANELLETIRSKGSGINFI